MTKCYLCNVREGTINLDNHNNNEIFICSECDQKYSVKSKLEKGIPLKENVNCDYSYTKEYCFKCRKDTKMKIFNKTEKYICTVCEIKESKNV